MNSSVLIEPSPLPGAKNMAIDEAMLLAAIEDDFIGLRFYQWEQPTLSLGHFQKPDRISIEDRFQDLPIVRRLSGGGAILHDRELTYSCVTPASHPLSETPSQLYDLIHNAFIQVLKEIGIDCSVRGESKTELDSEFLCFLRGDPRDLIFKSQKILGSAQRRRKGAVLQHGSLILHSSTYAQEIPGIFDLSKASNVGFEKLSERLKQGITLRLKVDDEPLENKAIWDKFHLISDSMAESYRIIKSEDIQNDSG